MKRRTPLVLAVAAALTAIAPVATAAPTPNAAAALRTGGRWLVVRPTGVGVPNGLAAF